MPPRSMNYLIQALGKILLEAVKNEIANKQQSEVIAVAVKVNLVYYGKENKMVSFINQEHCQSVFEY